MFGFSLLAASLPSATPCAGMAMVYYGGTPADFDTIAQYPPQILVPGDIPTLASIAPQMHDAGVKLFAYIATACCNTGCFGDAAPLATVEGEVDQALQDGADGVFFDEGSTDPSSGCNPPTYYSDLYSYVKGKNPSTIVTVNPGVGQPAASWFGASPVYADILSLECEWTPKYFTPGNYDVPASRVWGLDSTNASDCGNLSCATTASTCPQAVSDTQAAQANGVGNFYATSSYVLLPNWYPSYYQTVVSQGLCIGGGGSTDAGTMDAGSSAPNDGGGGTDGGSGGPVVTALFLANSGSGTPLTTVQAGGSYDLVINVQDPTGFSSVIFADLWWSAPGVTLGTIANRGGPYTPGQNYVLSYSFADTTLWEEEPAGWINITGKMGLYADGTSFTITPSGTAGSAKALITLSATACGNWTLSAYGQRAPFTGGLKSPLFTSTVVIAGGVAAGDSGCGEEDAGLVAIDSGAMPVDGSLGPGDAGPRSADAGAAPADAGTRSGDAGSGSGNAAGQCGCGSETSNPAVFLLAMLLLGGVRRRVPGS
jgi:hypothetical protein